jgi:hypothetical protein
MAVSVLKPQFGDAGDGGVSSETMFASFDQALGTAPEMPSNAATVVTADFQVPFLAHATMEPMACTALLIGLRRDERAYRQGGVARAGQDDLEP